MKTRFYTARSADDIAKLANQPLMPFARERILEEVAEHGEHITLEAAEDETRYAYSRNGDASLEVFTGV